MRVDFEEGALLLADYPFRRGERSPRIAAASIAEICVNWSPPTVRTRDGEYLFVDATRVRELAAFGERNRISFVRREDLWALILEPFLDTERGPDDEERTLARLEACGVSREEVGELRRRVEPRMLALTALTWEWVHYGLHDVLDVMRSTGADEFAMRAMKLADRGTVTPSSADELLRLFAAK